MLAPAAPPAAPAAGASRAARLRLAGIVVLAAAVAVVAWAAFLRKPAGRGPESVFLYVQSRVLDGDTDAPWRMMLPLGREKYGAYTRARATRDDAASVEWRRRVGLSKQALAALAPERVMALEYKAFAEECFRGARLGRTDIVSGDEALLNITLGNGTDRQWMVKRVDGVWKVSDPVPVITEGGGYIENPGTSGRQLPFRLDGSPSTTDRPR